MQHSSPITIPKPASTRFEKTHLERMIDARQSKEKKHSLPKGLQCENKHLFQLSLVECDNSCKTLFCACGAEVHRRGRWICAGHDPNCGVENES